MKALWRVVISWTYNGLAFLTTRGVIAESSEQALRDAGASVRIDRADPGWSARVDHVDCLSAFPPFDQSLPVVNGQGQDVKGFFGE